MEKFDEKVTRLRREIVACTLGINAMRGIGRMDFIPIEQVASGFSMLAKSVLELAEIKDEIKDEKVKQEVGKLFADTKRLAFLPADDPKISKN